MHAPLLPPCSTFSLFSAGHSSCGGSYSSGIRLEKFVSGPKAGRAESQQPYPSPPMSNTPPSPRWTRARESGDHQLRSEEQFRHRRRSLEPVFPAVRLPAVSSAEQRRVALPAPQHQQQQHQSEHYTQRRETRSSHPELLSTTSGSAQQTRPFEFPRQYPTVGHGGPVAIPAPANPFVTPGPHHTPRGARRNKAHVASACVNCKKAHLSCDVQRPCTRCVASGKESSCYDVQHKKRGRPRLRDSAVRARSQEETEPAEQSPPIAAPSLQSSASSALSRPRAGSLRTLRSGRRATLGSLTAPRSITQPTLGERHLGEPAVPHWSPTMPVASRRPVALLDLDFTLLKTNQVFNDFFGSGSPMTGRALVDIVEPGMRENLQRLRSDLREERDAREPAYMAPIFGPRDHEAVQDIEETDLDRISQGYDERSQTWRMRFSHGVTQDIDVRVRLAKTSIFFISLVLPPVPSTTEHQQQQERAPQPTQTSRPPSSLSRGAPSTEYTFSPYAHSSPPNVSEPASPYSPYFSLQSITSSLPSAAGHSPAYSYTQLPLSTDYPPPPTAAPPGYHAPMHAPPHHHAHPQPLLSPYRPSSRVAERSGPQLHHQQLGYGSGSGRPFELAEYRYATPRSSGPEHAQSLHRYPTLSLLLEGTGQRSEAGAGQRARGREDEEAQQQQQQQGREGQENPGKRRRLDISDMVD